MSSSSTNGGGALHRLPSNPGKSSSSILHVRENSIDELEALFDPAKWSMRQKLPGVPLNKRNLPPSFFRPPETGTKTPRANNYSNNHSRQSSIDQSYASQQSQQAALSKQHQMLHQKLSVLTNSHLRSISEPVNVSPQSYAQMNSYQPETNKLTNSHIAMGWQTAKSSDGQIYFYKYIKLQNLVLDDFI